MEHERFDHLARELAAGMSRRGVVRQLTTAAIGGVLAAVGAGEAGARKHRKSGSHPAAGEAKGRKKKRSCPTGKTRCKIGKTRHGKKKKACVDLQTDARHCGRCATTCETGQTCVAGACTGPCIPDCQEKECGSDGCSSNCGACSGGKVCQQGQCDCPAGQSFCTGQCTDIQTDPANCGGCGTICEGGGSCQNGQCGCPAGLTKCGGQCVSTADDPANCGACGNVCNLPNANASCSGGTCAVASCDPGFADCDGHPATGCETDVTDDTDNCGACGNICPAGDRCGTFPPGCGSTYKCCVPNGGVCFNACDCCSTACAFFNGGQNPGTCVSL